MSEILPQDNPPRKQCSKCPKSYPATNEFFPRDKSKKSGLASQCKNCKNQRNSANKEHVNEKRRQQRRQADQQQRDEDNARRRQHYQENREHALADKRIYHQEHREEIREYKREYHRANNERRVEYNRQWIKDHKEQRAETLRRNYLEHQEERRAYLRAYRHTEKGKAVARAHSQKRRAQKKAIDGEITTLQIQTKLKAQRYKCYYCQKKLEKVKGCYIYHLDHTVPLSRTECNPRHDINYVVLTCPACNLEKHDKRPHEWARGNRLL